MLILALLTTFAAALAGGAPRQQIVGDSRTALGTVSDARNRFIVDLGPDDFLITERGQPREILDAHMADYPIVILVDTGSAAREGFHDMRKAVAHFIARLGQRPIALGTLADPPATIEEDRAAVARRLEALTPTTADSSALQAASNAAVNLRAIGPRFSAIVVIAATANDTTRAAADELAPPIVDSGAVVHVIVNRGAPDAPMSVSAEALQRLSNQTHGQFTAIYSTASYQAALDRLADRLSYEMMIEYIVPAQSRATDIQVGVRIPGARAHGLGVRPR